MMTPEQFCYWLQGLFECKPVGEFLTLAETMSVRDHLLTVFQKRTPDRREQHRERQITEAISRTRRVC